MELEIKVMWCKGLTTAFNFFQKLTVYATVSITSSNDKIQLTHDQKQEQKTPVDENGEGDPQWNYSMKFDLRPFYKINPTLDHFCLLFELRCPGQIFGDKSIGEVRVPLKELIQSVGYQVVRFVKYEVRNSEGKHNGILDFSYKLIGNNLHDTGILNPNHHVQIMGYHHHHHPNHDQQSLHHQNHEQHHTFSETMIQYPRIDLEPPSAPPLIYPPPSSSSSSSSSPSYYYASSSSFTSTYGTHYNPPAPSYPPSSSQIWAPPPTHYPPPPVQQPYVYPPPPPPQQQRPPPYGDPHWGYHRW